MVPVVLAVAFAAVPTVRVAVYDGPGVSGSRAAVVAGLQTRFAVVPISPAGIRAGELATFDLVVHPGGIAGTQGKALGEAGRKAEVEFLRGGGGYLGICAGAYLATCDYEWSLHVLNAVVADKEHWNRGTATVAVTTTVFGRQVLETDRAKIDLYYHQGPLLTPAYRRDLPEYDECAAFAGDVYGNGAVKGIMPGTTAACAAAFGKGRVFTFSPHPEKTTETVGLLCAAAAWAARVPVPELGVAESRRKR